MSVPVEATSVSPSSSRRLPRCTEALAKCFATEASITFLTGAVVKGRAEGRKKVNDFQNKGAGANRRKLN